MKNSVKNLGYLIYRLKNCGYVVWKIKDKYNVGDTRKWTILVNPGLESVYITCCVNEQELDYSPVFKFDGGSLRFSNGLQLSTKSVESIVEYLMENGVTPDSNLFRHKDKINSYSNDGRE